MAETRENQGASGKEPLDEAKRPGFTPVEETIYARRSVRLFKDRQVPEDTVRRVLEAARFAPSAGNSQPWRFTVIQDREIIADMTKDVARFCKVLMACADYIDPGKGWKKPAANLFQRIRPNDTHPIPFGAMKLIAEEKLSVWHGAPTVILLYMDRRGVGTPEVDLGIAGQNMVLAAHSLGLGTCWVSFVKPLTYLPWWRKRLGLGYPFKLVTSIALGYPRGNPDGIIPRETRRVEWIADSGVRKVVY